jgi:hypothetical protein
METDLAAEMKPDTGPHAFAVSFFLSPSPSFPSLTALALKVTFASLDIFLPRSKLRCKATSGLPGYFWRILVP